MMTEKLRYFYLLGFFKEHQLRRLFEAKLMDYGRFKQIMDTKKEVADANEITIEELEKLSDEALELLYKEYLSTQLKTGIHTLKTIEEFNNKLTKSDSKINKTQIEMFKNAGYTELMKNILEFNKDINNGN